MVSSINGIVDSTSNINQSRETSPTGSNCSSLSSQEQEMENTRLQYFWDRYKDKGFSQKSIDLLSSTLDNNSSTKVSSAIRIWVDWCFIKCVDPTTCSLNSICEFFADQLADGKSFNTIAGYRSAISEIHDLVDNLPIGKHPDIIKAMQAVHSENPPDVHSDEPIDINPSLDYISELGNNDSMSIRDLSLKTAFLLALVTACRPSDLHRINVLSCKSSNLGYTFECVEPKEYKIAVAHSLATSKSRVKKLFIGKYQENRSLCPYEAVTTLLSRTQQWRDTEKQKKALFLITRQPYTPASVDTIANWIKSIIRLSSSESKAKDLRVLSAFFAQNAGAGLESILALGNWSSNNTYHRFYQRGIKLMLEKNRISTMILNEATSFKTLQNEEFGNEESLVDPLQRNINESDVSSESSSDDTSKGNSDGTSEDTSEGTSSDN